MNVGIYSGTITGYSRAASRLQVAANLLLAALIAFRKKQKLFNYCTCHIPANPVAAEKPICLAYSVAWFVTTANQNQLPVHFLSQVCGRLQ